MERVIKLLSIFTIFPISIFYFLSSGKVYADTPCQPIYGGGTTCTSSTSIEPEKKIAPTPTYAVMQKSGFPVMPPPTISKTPSTGPEALALFSLIPIGIAGFFLRRRSKQ